MLFLEVPYEVILCTRRPSDLGAFLMDGPYMSSLQSLVIRARHLVTKPRASPPHCWFDHALQYHTRSFMHRSIIILNSQSHTASRGHHYGLPIESIPLANLNIRIYVRPMLEYCTCVLSPYLLEDNRKIEFVQRYFTRKLFPKNSYSYNERPYFFIEFRISRSRAEDWNYDLKMYFKIMNNLTIINPTDFCLVISVWPGALDSNYKSVCFTVIVSPTHLQTEQLIVGIRCPMKLSMLNLTLFCP